MFKKIWYPTKWTVIAVVGAAILIYALLWAFSFNTFETQFGVSFSPEYAGSLGLDWRKAYQAILTDLKPPLVRLSAQWNKIEPRNNRYDFSEMDYLVNEAGKNNAKILFAIGQKIPRWPECYFPQWLRELEKDKRETEILSYIETVVNRYKNNQVVEYWQVENEPFIRFDFGECDGFNKDLVKEEVELVKRLDPSRRVVITDSGEMSVWHSASKAGDVLGSTLYRLIVSRYGFLWHYDYLPAGLYRAKARLFGKNFDNFFISELQAEPWFHNGSPLTTEMTTQELTINPKQLQKNIDYAKRVGASRVYFWGAEWWYWLKTTKNNSTYWEIVKKTIAEERVLANKN